MPPTSSGRLPSPRVVLIAGFVVAVLVAVLLAVLLTKHQHGRPRAGSSGSGSPTPQPTGSLPSPTTSPSVPSFTPSNTPTGAQASLLAKRHGFAGRVTGGGGGEYVHISTDADSGTGSLRAALQGDSPRWIVFDKDMTIHLKSALAVGSNKTIDGRGHKVEITGPNLNGLVLDRTSNVIIESLTLHDFGNVKKTKNNDLPDAIHLDGAKGVWIDHNDLSMAGDKLIAVAGGTTGVTVSWNHFHDQLQVFQIGDQTEANIDTRQTVTVDHNFFDRTGYRNPVVSYGRAHVYNNYFLDWQVYAVRSERAAQMYLQNNVFRAGRNPRAAITNTGGDGCNDNHTRCDPRRGDLKITGNLLLGGAKIRSKDVTGSNDVFTPNALYHYTAAPATTALAASVQKGAGPQR